MDNLPVILGTAVTLATFMGAAGLFVLRAVIARDVKPLSDQMIRLSESMTTLTTAISQQRTDARYQREELHEAIDAIRVMLGQHQAQLGNHDTRITVLEQPLRRQA